MPVKASITYKLSQQGQRASLLQGGDGKANQVTIGDVEAADIDLFAVNEDGTLHFDATIAPTTCATDKYHSVPSLIASKWGSRVRVEWDVVPSWDDLLMLARWLDETKRIAEEEMWQDHLADEEAANRIAAAFRADPNARAEKVAEDSVQIGGHSFWDSATVEEAKRRWAHDREELKQANRATLATWIAEHGTPNQRQRLHAGLLPWEEAHKALEQHLFAPLESFELYSRFDPEQVCECRQMLGASEICNVKFKSVDATELTAGEWERYSAIRDTVADAQFQLREHQADCTSIILPKIKRGVIVKRTVGRLTFKREFAL